MTPERWQQVKALLDAALDRAPAERPEFLAGACRGDGELRGEVETLLALERESGDFIVTPIFSFHGEAEGPEEDPNLGRLVGPYRLLERLGRGGMGAVYLAERADGQFEQRVAVKLIKRGMDSEEILRRFRAERQILAHLRHDSIARLLDGGTTEDGLPYFALEYVEGEPIDRYCDARRLATAERLRLFRTVCEAVHTAHRSLVVHRDLKPGNILVTAQGVPKLLDFGIAKLLAPDSDGTGAETLLGELPMTPGYASPEQLRGEPITTASDVYSLGVLLYELLTGRRPYPLQTLSRSEWLRAFGGEEPLRPSSAVRRPASPARSGTTRPVRREPGPGASRGGAEAPAESAIPVEAPGETGRAASSAEAAPVGLPSPAGVPSPAGGGPPPAAGALAVPSPDDLARLRDGDPRRLRRRLAGDLDTIVMKAIAREPERRYASAEQLAEDIQRHLDGLPVVARPDTLGYRTAKFVRRNRIGLAAAAGALLAVSLSVTAATQRQTIARERDQARAERDRAKAVTGFLVDVFRVPDPSRSKGEAVTARQVLDQGAKKAAEELADQPEIRATLLDAMGRVYRQLGLYDEARPLLEEALRARREVLGPEHPLVADSLQSLAVLRRSMGENEAAESLFREALALQRRLLAPDDAELGSALHNLASLRSAQGAFSEAESLFREALAIKRLHASDDDPEVVGTLNSLAVLRQNQGDYQGAETLYRQVLAARRRNLAPPDPDLANSINNLAVALAEQGRDFEAEPLYAEGLAMRRQLYREPHDSVGASLNNLGYFLQARGRLQEAEPLLREALAVWRQTLGEDHERTATVKRNLADLLALTGAAGGCEQLAREALGAFRTGLRPGHWRVADAESVLGGCLARLGRFQEAEPLLLRGHEGLAAAAARAPYRRAALTRLVALYEAWGKPDLAARYRSQDAAPPPASVP